VSRGTNSAEHHRRLPPLARSTGVSAVAVVASGVGRRMDRGRRHVLTVKIYCH
jgi:hypothetical protein